MTQFYIGCKMIEAWPQERNGNDGYAVKYPDGYTSWSPKEAFESAYLPMGLLESPDMSDVANNNRITRKMVTDFIGNEVQAEKMGEKTTVVQCTLANGYVITESSSCVDPANYDETIGIKCCMDRIENKVWELLGFLLQTAKYGIKKK